MIKKSKEVDSEVEAKQETSAAKKIALIVMDVATMRF
jgi:hypothetical protein